MSQVENLLKEASKLDRLDREELVSSLLEDLDSLPHWVSDEETASRLADLKAGWVQGHSEDEFRRACRRAIPQTLGKETSMIRELRREALAYWEKRRIIYNLLLIPPSWFSWGISQSFTYSIDDREPASLTDPMVILTLVTLFVGANLCYSVVYVLEFFFMSEKRGKLWPYPGRTIFLIAGCLLGMALSAQNMSRVEQMHAGPALPYDP